MPTGYTVAIKDGMSFEQFVWGCARGMGALIMMRDEPANAPIPERFEPDTAHDENTLNKAREQLAWLRQMPTSEAEREAAKEFEIEAARQAKSIQESIALRLKYEALLAQVHAWVPPTPDHIGMRQFMVQQLTDSISFDCNEDYYLARPAVRQSGAEWRAAQIAKYEREVVYHTEQCTAEIERTTKRNEWLAALRKSLEGAK